MAFRYLMENDGIVSESEYPYELKTKTCRTGNKTRVTTISDYIEIEKGNEELLKRVVALHGPVSVNLYASDQKFQSYKSGIYFDEKCNHDELNHGVLLIGYGTEKLNNTNVDYWILKNQYTTDWGENGYMKMIRNKNMCGIASGASYPVLKDNDIIMKLRVKRPIQKNDYYDDLFNEYYR